MKSKNTEIIDQLLGFDLQQLEARMTDGFDDWCHQRAEAARDRRFVARTCYAMALVVFVFWQTAPTADYRLADRVNYEQAKTAVCHMLGL